ncbi:MAG TPA: hypothetical protein VLW65_21945 [Bryobacteraceae bacterium]|nr:hypothetical protein [Bryobacteraceae bacterium]
MKTAKVRYIIAAAALAVAAANASAQTYKAEIPLSFSAGQTGMLPGAYQIDVNTSEGGTVLVRLRNVDANRSIMLIAGVRSDAPKAWLAAGKPLLAFECTEGACTLGRIFDGRDTTAYNFPHASPHRGESKVALIMLTPAKSE